MNLIAALLTGGRMPAQLVRHWTKGPGGAEIGWRTKGAFRRCEIALKGKGVPANQVPGACARLHKKATGKWPNEKD